jgi:hypothetical protein
MNPANLGQDWRHVPFSLLWQYSQNHDMRLFSAQLDHLTLCEECIGILWICRTSSSLQDARTRLIEHGISAV